ncbi:GntR family transcriptional regulator [Achromobacter veterisilvae]|uniref:GntR family transcriptional regulator n=1 Tax=Achromobacter veterisilvae TaxID=2069367 RepID=A0A446CKF3_9BURK|nr:GntR family transcriptional regulator [Achromobacter veterisilvae]SSW68243.1 HTH-type transcriptional regulator McbR [Achromobacter veterisilvae]
MTRARRPASTFQAVILNLREKISLQSILPGARLTEDELVDNYDIPRATAREVLAVLEERGLVVRIPNKGAVVAHVDMQSIYHYYDVREALDGMMVRLAASNTRPEDWADLVEQFGEPFQTALETGDVDQLIALIETFRERLQKAANNPILADHAERVHERIRIVRRRVALLPGRAETVVADYRAVLAALERSDAVDAERLMGILNRNNREAIKKYERYVV